MFAFLRGRLVTSGDVVVLDVGGLGFSVQVSLRTARDLPPPGSTVTLHTWMHVREDGVGLYGFLEAAERDLFLLLLEVNGLGPKGALNLLSSYSPDRLKEIIVSGDVSSLVRVSGIGPKLAQRIVLELKDKLARLSSADRRLSPSPLPDEVVAALTALGYTPAEAEAALVEARRTLGNEAGTEELVAHCLKILDRAGGRDEEEA